MFDDAACFRCDSPLPPPLDEAGTGPAHALVVRFDGGHGMFCDPGLDEQEWTLVLCHGCAHELADFIGLNPSDWHEHFGRSAWGSDQHHR